MNSHAYGRRDVIVSLSSVSRQRRRGQQIRNNSPKLVQCFQPLVDSFSYCLPMHNINQHTANWASTGTHHSLAMYSNRKLSVSTLQVWKISTVNLEIFLKNIWCQFFFALLGCYIPVFVTLILGPKILYVFKIFAQPAMCEIISTAKISKFTVM